MSKEPYQIVIDTNVIVSGLRSSKGAAYKLLSILDDKRWQTNLSVGLVLEYEAILKRYHADLGLLYTEIDRVVEDFCSIANLHAIFYVWRPSAKDPNDDFLVDLVVKCQANFLITYNKRDFTTIGNFGVRVITPKEFLEIVGEL